MQRVILTATFAVAALWLGGCATRVTSSSFTWVA